MYKKAKVKQVLYLVLENKSNSYISNVLKTSRSTIIEIKAKLATLNKNINDLLIMDDDDLYHLFFPQ